MRLTLEDAFINGDPIANQGRGFEGLARRLPSGSEIALSNGGSRFLVMSKAMRRQPNALARAASGRGIVKVTTNSMGVMVHRYQECEILSVERDAQGRYGISVRDLGEVPDAPVFRTRIDWYVGFSVMHPRSAGRLHDIAPLG